MAITICSSSKHTTNLHTISVSSFQTKSYLKFPHQFAYISCTKFGIGVGLASDDALSLVVASEAVALAGAAAEVARDAVASAYEVENMVLDKREGGNEVERGWRNGLMMRRKRRRKRRRQKIEEDNGIGEDMHVCLRPANEPDNYFTPHEEAEHSWHLKENARIEEVRRRLADGSEQDPTRSQWTKATEMSDSSLSKILLKGRESQERIIRSYRRLVASIAASYQGRGLSLQDLIQEGSIGLVRGAKKFNPDKGNKLSTYVYWWIRQAITRAIANKSRIIRLPGSICELVPKIAEAKTALGTRFRRLPTPDEIAEHVGVDDSMVRLVSERTRAHISIDQAVTTPHGCMSLQEIIAGPDEVTPETMLKKKLIKQEVEKLLGMLYDREVNVLRLYYGLNGETPKSFEEIGRLLNLSRERVRQIYHIAISKLKKSCLVDNLKLYLV